MTAPPVIELRGIDKWFGEVHANQDIALAIHPGTIHGIVGENGAGKSTLMGILYGYHLPDRGEILVRGRPAAIRSPQDALASGIGMVHQHFMLVEPFTVLENVVLGVEGGFLLKAGLARARAELLRLGREYHLEVDLGARVGDLDVGQRQRVEILKALYRGADLLILDEPTAVLTPQEADHLFRILRALRAEGKTVVLITHKLREIREVTDVVTVMRQGRIVATLPTAGTTAEQLAELMVGRRVSLRVDKTPARPGEAVLEVADLTVEDELGVERVKAVSFAVRRGEIVGIAGVAGNGQSELFEALAGIRPVKSGRIRWRGRDITGERARSPHGMRRLGLSHVPEDRQRMGLDHPLLGPGKRHPRLPRRGDLQPRALAPPGRRRGELPSPGGGLRRPARGRVPSHLGVLWAATSRRSCWRGSSSGTRTFSSSASRRAAWTSARSSSSTGASSRSATAGRRSFSSRSSWTRSWPSPTASWSCTTGGSSGRCRRRRPPSRPSVS